MPCTSAGSRAMAGDHSESKWSPNLSAADAHCVFKCAVGATTITRHRRSVITHRAADSAKVVFPAPGVATAKKSGNSDARNFSSAARCQGRRRIARLITRTLSQPQFPPPRLVFRSRFWCHPPTSPGSPSNFARFALSAGAFGLLGRSWRVKRSGLEGLDASEGRIAEWSPSPYDDRIP